MRFSIPRVRAVLVVGASVLLLVLVAYIGMGRYRSLMVYRLLVKRSGVTLTHDTNGFTYSQSLQGRTVFTLHAAKATQLGSGKYALHNADLTLYDRAGKPADHITGSEIDYDENEGVARAQGVVDMDLLPPQSLTNGGRAVAEGGRTDAAKRADALASVETKAAPAEPVHVRTSGLVYQRKLGIATTDQRVLFRYGGMEATALGAEFHSNENTLRLLAQVQMVGVAHGRPLYVIATSADMDRDANLATLVKPEVTSNGRTATADNAVLNLRSDGAIERLQASEHVVMRSATQVITAQRLDATLNQQMLPEKAKLSGGVALTGNDPLRPMHGSAATVDVLFNAQGSPTLMTGSGGAKLWMVDKKKDPRGLGRSMEGNTIVATFVPGDKKSSVRVSEVHAVGGGHAMGESVAKDKAGPTGLKTTQVWGDDLRMTFVAAAGGRDKVQPQKLYAIGHTVLQQDAPMGAMQTSSGDTLEVLLADGVSKDGLGVASAVQDGHVTMHSRAASKVGSKEAGSKEAVAKEAGAKEAGSKELGAASSGTAERASYDGVTQRLTLTGNARLEGDDASLTAPTVAIDQVTQNVEAQGGVQATMEGERRDNGAAGGKAAPVTHVMSASARFEHAAKLAEFRGTDAQPARMWQDASQVLAATLLFDGVRHTFSARPDVAGTSIHAVFVGKPAAPKAGADARPTGIVRVASPKMDYNELLHEATFSGGVTMDGSKGDVKGQRAVLLMTQTKEHAGAAAAPVATQADPFGGTGWAVDRVIVSGAVKMDQPGRQGTGEQLLYTVATGSYVLTGTPAELPLIVDAEQGSVTGTTLMFSDEGSTIVVAGDAAAKGQGGRVRSEMNVKPKQDERQ